MADLQTALDDATGALLDLIDAFPMGGPGSHLAMHFYAELVPRLLPLVSEERSVEWPKTVQSDDGLRKALVAIHDITEAVPNGATAGIVLTLHSIAKHALQSDERPTP